MERLHSTRFKWRDAASTMALPHPSVRLLSDVIIRFQGWNTPQFAVYYRMRYLLAFISLLSPALLLADEGPAASAEERQAGHSSHGEAFDQGPRREAVLLDPAAMGNIEFPITTSVSEAQAFFNQGVGQLHGFWYYEAERSFRQVLKLDPRCKMAYWGLAMANFNNAKRAKEFLQTAGKMTETISPREEGWIKALTAFFADDKGDEKARHNGLVKALEKLSFDNPDDIEIKAFLVFHIWDNESHGIQIPSHQAVDALARQVLAQKPMHPIHHYLIHLWNGVDDRRALTDAARCGQSEPGIAHMWHMSGHTFTQLHRYADAAWQQEASARVDHADIMRWRIMPEEIHNYAHNNDWLIEDLSYIGRIHDAIDLARNMVELPRLAPKSQVVGKEHVDDNRAGYLDGERRLLQVLPRFELWEDLCNLEDTTYLAPLSDTTEETRRLSTLGAAWFMKGDRVRGEAKYQAVAAGLAKAREARYAEADAAEKAAKAANKPETEVAKAMADALLKHSREIKAAESALAQIEVYRALGAGDLEATKAALAKADGMPKELLIPIKERLGDLAGAVETAHQLADTSEGQVLGQALLSDALWQSGKKEEAVAAFKKLRDLCGQADLDLPVFKRLTSVAAEAGTPADWRPELKWPADSGVRPALASLGPFRYQPYVAPDWQLTDRDGHSSSLTQFKGKPVLVIFYLGHGCTHCVEQLNLFAPEAQAYSEAGISIVAVSSDTADDLTKTYSLITSTPADDVPFPIIANPQLDVFKAYHCFDEFENTPLHGTFLVDGNGLVRWQNISAEPFREPKWLLTEAKRLLALEPKLKDAVAAAK